MPHTSICLDNNENVNLCSLIILATNKSNEIFKSIIVVVFAVLVCSPTVLCFCYGKLIVHSKRLFFFLGPTKELSGITTENI